MNGQENFTLQEENVLTACRTHAIREFSVGGTVALGITWLATRRLSDLLRINLSAATPSLRDLVRINLSASAATISGFWRGYRSLDTCVEQILSGDGSRMQMEFANIILSKYGDDASTMQLLAKHFYSEKVFDDSSIDQPKIRWRYRNFFSDNVAFFQWPHNGDAHGDGEKTESQKTDMECADEPIRVLRSPVSDATTNPFDDVLGISRSSEEINHPNTSGLSPKRHGRRHKKSHRRHRKQHHEASSEFPHS